MFEIIDKEGVCSIIGPRELTETLGFLHSYLCMQSNRHTGFRINLEQLQ
jgi:hypothetical protein